jgi:iodotyrosine deiodinase
VNDFPTVAAPNYPQFDADEMNARSAAFAQWLNSRRTLRDYASEPVPRATIEACIRAAGTAPSGANRQPWHFVAVSCPTTKRAIREAAETEERAFYDGKAPKEWLDALAPLGTDPNKPFLDVAPWLIAVFLERQGVDAQGRSIKNYYSPESVGIAVGFLLAALHDCGLATLTHTPSPMGFLRDILGRPKNERAYLLVVTGRPAADALVPDVTRKPLDEIATFVEPGER